MNILYKIIGVGIIIFIVFKSVVYAQEYNKKYYCNFNNGGIIGWSQKHDKRLDECMRIIKILNLQKYNSVNCMDNTLLLGPGI